MKGVKIMGLDLTAVWDVLDKLLEAGNAFVEAQVEQTYGTIRTFLKSQVAKTETEFDDNALKTIELGIRDKLIKEYPLDEYPLD